MEMLHLILYPKINTPIQSLFSKREFTTVGLSLHRMLVRWCAHDWWVMVVLQYTGPAHCTLEQGSSRLCIGYIQVLMVKTKEKAKSLTWIKSSLRWVNCTRMYVQPLGMLCTQNAYIDHKVPGMRIWKICTCWKEWRLCVVQRTLGGVVSQVTQHQSERVIIRTFFFRVLLFVRFLFLVRLSRGQKVIGKSIRAQVTEGHC